MQRDYDEGLDDEVVDGSTSPAGPRAARSTPEEGRGLHRDVGESKRGPVPSAAKSALRQTAAAGKAERVDEGAAGARRRRELRGPVTERAWPTRKQLSAAARAHRRDDDDEEGESARCTRASSSSSSSSSSGEEEESDDDEEEEGRGGGRGGRRGGRARGGGDSSGTRLVEEPKACDAQFGQSLTAQEVAALSERRPAAEYASTGVEHVTERPPGGLGAIGRRGASTGRALRRGRRHRNAFVAGAIDV